MLLLNLSRMSRYLNKVYVNSRSDWAFHLLMSCQTLQVTSEGFSMADRVSIIQMRWHGDEFLSCLPLFVCDSFVSDLFWSAQLSVHLSGPWHNVRACRVAPTLLPANTPSITTTTTNPPPHFTDVRAQASMLRRWLILSSPPSAPSPDLGLLLSQSVFEVSPEKN